MNTIATINIALEIFALVILSIIMVSMQFDKNNKMPLNRKFIRLLWCCIIVLPSDILSWGLNGNTNPQIFPVLLVSNFCVYAFSILGAAAYNDYTITFIATKTNISKASVHIINRLCWLHGILLIISQFNHMLYYIDETNSYCRGNLFFVAYTIPTIISVMQIAIIIRHRKNLVTGDTLAFLSYNILLFLGVMLQSMLNLVMLLYIFIAIGLFIVYIRIQVEQAKRLETELTTARIDIMLSQIQPHFLYNSLSAIEDLCDVDIEKTKTTINDFAHYLRGNLETIGQNKMIPFDNELEHLKTYMSLEKLRFGEKLNVAFDIQTSDFLIPPLTVQPIVENAVRHGIAKKSGGGSVFVCVKELENAYLITVKDTGIGFEPGRKNDNHVHIGIQNVQGRLKVQCGGKLEIDSSYGFGTTAVITIPKLRGASYEHNSCR